MRISKSAKIHHILSIIVRLSLGAIFVAAGIPKIMDTASFAGVVFNYHLLPDILINIFAIILPWLEVTLGSLLIIGIWLPGTVILYNLLMIVFIGALSFNTARGLDISCGCFSLEPGEIINMGTVLRDVMIFAASLYLGFIVFLKKTVGDKRFSPLVK